MRIGPRIAATAAVLLAGGAALTGCTPNPVVSMADGSAREGQLIPFATTLMADGAGNPDTARRTCTSTARPRTARRWPGPTTWA